MKKEEIQQPLEETQNPQQRGIGDEGTTPEGGDTGNEGEGGEGTGNGDPTVPPIGPGNPGFPPKKEGEDKK